MSLGSSIYINPNNSDVQKAARFVINQLNQDEQYDEITLVLIQSAKIQTGLGNKYLLNLVIEDNNALQFTIIAEVWCKAWLSGYASLSSPAWKLIFVQT